MVSLPAEVLWILDFVLAYLPYIVVILIPLVAIKALTKKRNYLTKLVEIKEAPLGINNLMKDPVKRAIVRSLKKERKYMSAISREINQNAPMLRYHLKQLEKASILKSFKLARESYFSLTKEGKWCLDAINYYYPETNLQFIVTRMKKSLNIFHIRKPISRWNVFADYSQSSEATVQ